MTPADWVHIVLESLPILAGAALWFLSVKKKLDDVVVSNKAHAAELVKFGAAIKNHDDALSSHGEALGKYGKELRIHRRWIVKGAKKTRSLLELYDIHGHKIEALEERVDMHDALGGTQTRPNHDPKRGPG